MEPVVLPGPVVGDEGLGVLSTWPCWELFPDGREDWF